MHNQHRMLRVFRLITMLRQRPARTIRNIALSLDISERSAYRYLDLLKDLGLKVQTDKFRRVFIEQKSEVPDAAVFTPEEATLIRNLVLTAAPKNKLRNGILQKLYANSELEVQSEILYRSHLSKMVEDISRAIQEKRQIVLKKYMSANSNDIRDRTVEPVKFTSGFERLVAYEPESGQNKTFNLERITSVQVMKKSWRHEKEHKYTQPDVFGFHENGRQYPVDIELTLRQSLVLREEYPATATCIEPIKGTKKFRFRAMVNDMRPVKRFLKGWEE